jgi:hypothetical protein
MEINGLPVYEVIVDENEVNFVALVDNPAIKRDFIAFNEQSNIKFEIVSEEERIISGPLMLADTPIYRKPPQVPEEGYLVFGKKAITSIVQKFFKEGKQSNVNLMHDAALQMDGVTMFESFIVDSHRGIKAMKGFEDAPEGSWFGSFKIDNPVVWELVKAQELKGFSIEGVFSYVKQEMSDADFLETVRALLYQ